MKVFTLLTDGDNCPAEVSVYRTEDDARAALVIALERSGARRGEDGHPLTAQSNSELAHIWEQLMDGMCSIEEHTL
jgi:hypothetical protein